MDGDMIFRVFTSLLLFIPSIVFSDVGFRDLKIGSPPFLIEKYCSVIDSEYQCYGIDDFVFYFWKNTPTSVVFSKKGEGIDNVKIGNDFSSVDMFCSKIGYFYECNGHTDLIQISGDGTKVTYIKVIKNSIKQIKVDIGPLYQTFLDNIISDPNNPYIKLKKSLDSNYEMEWEFTERDRKLFNEGEKDSLWTSYNGGQIFSQILREDKYSDLRLLVHYHTKEDGEKLSEERTPKNGSFDDF